MSGGDEPYREPAWLTNAAASQGPITLEDLERRLSAAYLEGAPAPHAARGMFPPGVISPGSQDGMHGALQGGNQSYLHHGVTPGPYPPPLPQGGMMQPGMMPLPPPSGVSGFNAGPPPPGMMSQDRMMLLSHQQQQQQQQHNRGAPPPHQGMQSMHHVPYGGNPPPGLAPPVYQSLNMPQFNLGPSQQPMPQQQMSQQQISQQHMSQQQISQQQMSMQQMPQLPPPQQLRTAMKGMPQAMPQPRYDYPPPSPVSPYPMPQQQQQSMPAPPHQMPPRSLSHNEYLAKPQRSASSTPTLQQLPPASPSPATESLYEQLLRQTQRHYSHLPPSLPLPMNQQQQQQAPQDSGPLPPSSPSLGPLQHARMYSSKSSPPASPTILPQTPAQEKTSSTARFEWRPVGTIDVSPLATGPDEYIDVTWEIPAKYVGGGVAFARSLQNQRRGGGSADRDDTSKGDWVGLFRARQRVDVSEGFILTREVAGRSTLDARAGVVRGKVRLRTPRGVGMYDFRYFRAGDDVANTSEPRLPLARSPAITVEVQGYALFEALDFASKNLKDASRLAPALHQLADLLKQIRTLRRPLGPNTSGSAASARAREDQLERDLSEEIWRVVHSCVERAVAADESLAEKIRATRQNELVAAEAEYNDARQAAEAEAEQQPKESAAEAAAAEPASSEDKEEEGEEDAAKADPAATEESPVIAHFRAMKRAWIAVRHDIDQLERDRASLGSGARAIIEEIRTNTALQSTMNHARTSLIQSYLSRYCPLCERFLKTYQELSQHVGDEHRFIVDPEWLPPGRTSFRALTVNEAMTGSISAAISRLIPTLVPGKNFYAERRALIDRLQSVLDEGGFTEVFGPYQLVPFGSSANTFGGPSSDLDLCLVLLNDVDSVAESDENQTERAVKAVTMVAEVLTARGYLDVDDARKTARIPIIKFKDLMPDETTGKHLECDICINNPLALRNTFLLRAYGTLDPRGREICLIVKRWANVRNVNDPSTHTLSSYGWILLVINYLQRVGLLPVLQEMPPPSGPRSVMSRGPDGRLHDTYFFGDPEHEGFQSEEARQHASNLVRSTAARVTTDASQLLIGFFWDVAYGADWRRFVSSVRTGKFVPKSAKASEDSWRLHPRLAIEDPFETSYDVGHVLRDSTYRRVKDEAARAYAILTARHVDHPTPEGEDPAQAGERVLAELLQPPESEEEEVFFEEAPSSIA